MAELRAYVALLGGQWRSLMSYRASFVVEMITNIGGTAFDVLAVLVIFRATRTVAGFTLPEAILMVSISSCAFNLADFGVGNIDRLKTYVRTGMMDSVLVRPLVHGAAVRPLRAARGDRQPGRAVPGQRHRVLVA